MTNFGLLGGTLEARESDEQCLRRELKEEIGANLLSSKFFKEYKHPSFYHLGQELIERLYISEVEGRLKPDTEIEDIIWLSKEDFENKKFAMITHNAEKLIPDLMRLEIW